MQTNYIIRCCYTCNRIVELKKKKTLTIPSIGKNKKQSEFSDIVGGNLKSDSHTGKLIGMFLQTDMN